MFFRSVPKVLLGDDGRLVPGGSGLPVRPRRGLGSRGARVATAASVLALVLVSAVAPAQAASAGAGTVASEAARRSVEERLAPASAPATRIVPQVPCDRTIDPNSHYDDTTHGFRYFTDQVGRPLKAINTAPVTTGNPGPRGTCQTRVGNFAPAPPPYSAQDFDGGHLIGAQFGGVDQRYDLVPQLATLNRAGGTYFDFENTARQCLNNGGTINNFEVSVDYPDYAGVHPNKFYVLMVLSNGQRNGIINATIPWDLQNGSPEDTNLRQLFSQARLLANC
ncbi:DNA/RNA non-specific endonuclease [Kitasatospora sp. NPDC057904]|uniref:DNA/RNA non-specific endonuclease n=1 Tax=Kitasatospora sp. NPDC057904 TaxID=3346275 RepID=UPI0036DDF508